MANQSEYGATFGKYSADDAPDNVNHFLKIIFLKKIKSHVEICSSSQWKGILFYLIVYRIPSPTTQITVKWSLIYPLKKKEKKTFYKPLFLLSNHTDIKSYCKKGGMPLLSITAAAVWQK